MTPASVILQPVVRGDTWEGINNIAILVNGVPPTAALATASIQFRKKPARDPSGQTLSTEDGSIVIDNASTWVMHVPQIALTLGAGEWFWDLETVDEDGVIKTYIRGTLEVQQDVTRV